MNLYEAYVYISTLTQLETYAAEGMEPGLNRINFPIEKVVIDRLLQAELDFISAAWTARAGFMRSFALRAALRRKFAQLAGYIHQDMVRYPDWYSESFKFRLRMFLLAVHVWSGIEEREMTWDERTSLSVAKRYEKSTGFSEDQDVRTMLLQLVGSGLSDMRLLVEYSTRHPNEEKEKLIRLIDDATERFFKKSDKIPLGTAL